MSDTPDTHLPEGQKTDAPEIPQEATAGASDTLPGAQDAANSAEATPAPAGEAGDGNGPVSAAPLPGGTDLPPDSDPPVDDRIAKGKGNKARAAALGQVPAPKPSPLPDQQEAEPDPDVTVIHTRAFPGPLLAFGGRARRAGWAPGYELTAENAADRTGRNMKLMTSGSRSGPVEWKPANLADELLADDWEVIVTSDQIDRISGLAATPSPAADGVDPA